MKPAPFSYIAPRSVDETLALLAEYGAEGKILAGGQSLVPLLAMRLARPQVLIDINGIRSLAYIRRKGDRLHVGALTRQRAVEESAAVRRQVPLLWEAIRFVGHPQIRNRGTVGGSLAHADPSAELPAVAAALDAELIVRSRSGERSLSPGEFFAGYLTTALEPVDFLTEIRFPLISLRTGTAFLEVARRHGDFALAGVAAVIRRDNGTISEARLAFTGVGPGPVRAREAEGRLAGSAGTPRVFADAAREAGARLDPESDIHATARYRREVATALARRALELAWKRSGGRTQ